MDSHIHTTAGWYLLSIKYFQATSLMLAPPSLYHNLAFLNHCETLKLYHTAKNDLIRNCRTLCVGKWSCLRSVCSSLPGAWLSQKEHFLSNSVSQDCSSLFGIRLEMYCESSHLSVWWFFLLFFIWFFLNLYKHSTDYQFVILKLHRATR